MSDRHTIIADSSTARGLEIELSGTQRMLDKLSAKIGYFAETFQLLCARSFKLLQIILGRQRFSNTYKEKRLYTFMKIIP